MLINACEDMTEGRTVVNELAATEQSPDNDLSTKALIKTHLDYERQINVPISGFLALLWLFVIDRTNTKFAMLSWFLALLLPLISA